MKNLIFLFALILVGSLSYGQSTLKPKPGKTVNTFEKDTWAWLGTASTPASDSLGVVQDSISQSWTIYAPDSVRNFIKLKLKEVSSPARVIVQYRTKPFDSDSWAIEQTITYTGVGTDSTIYIKDNGLYKYHPFKNILLIRVNNKSYVEHLSGYIKK
jgi:hypothetical protein